MMDMKAFFSMSYGLYIVSSKANNKAAGCVVNTLAQVTSEPARMSVTVNKDNYTARIIEDSGVFAGVVLSQNATMELIGKFGFGSSSDSDKFAGLRTAVDGNGVPYVTEQTVARFSCRVVDAVDVGTHVIFIGEVTEAQVIDRDAPPMTYAHYHLVKKGITPPKASSYQPEENKKGFRCKICGYTLGSDNLPSDFVCPICGKGAEFFEAI